MINIIISIIVLLQVMVDQGQGIVQKNIELASQQDEK